MADRVIRTWTDGDVKELVRRTREESGVPAKVTDPAVLGRTAEILADHDTERAAS